MRIVDDQLVFDPADISQFSPGVQKALALLSGPGVAPESVLATAFNSTVKAAISALKRIIVESLAPLADAFAIEEDTAKVSAVRDLLNQARTVLEVPIVVPKGK